MKTAGDDTFGINCSIGADLDGIDFAKFHFNTGTVYDAHMDNGDLIVQCNPSLPAQAFMKDKAVREWRIRSNIFEG